MRLAGSNDLFLWCTFRRMGGNSGAMVDTQHDRIDRRGECILDTALREPVEALGTGIWGYGYSSDGSGHKSGGRPPSEDAWRLVRYLDRLVESRYSFAARMADSSEWSDGSMKRGYGKGRLDSSVSRYSERRDSQGRSDANASECQQDLSNRTR